MSNSSLVSYTKISPNCNSPRNHKIDTISIHCMACNATVESCGNGFANSSKKASSNYGIGSDGRIGLYVNESDRSWCTSSGSNDNRAITIEVANDGGGNTGWHVSDVAYESLIRLLTDVCKRNNIKELLWKADKSLIGQVDKQNMTVHRWFEAKACPGDYLYNKHSDIVKRVNNNIAGTGDCFDIIDKVSTSASDWKTSIDCMITLGQKTDTFSVLKYTKQLIEKIYDYGYKGDMEWDAIIRSVAVSADDWIIAINAIVGAAEADGDIGTLEIAKWFKVLIVKIYKANK